MKQKNILHNSSSTPMEPTFATKFKDKIQFMHKHGIKEMYQSPNGSSAITNTGYGYNKLVRSHIIAPLNKNKSDSQKKQKITTRNCKIQKRENSASDCNFINHQFEQKGSIKKNKTFAMQFTNNQSVSSNRGIMSVQNSRLKKNFNQLDSIDRQRVQNHQKNYLKYYNRDEENKSESINTLAQVVPSKYMCKVIQLGPENKQQLEKMYYFYSKSKNPQIQNLTIQLKEKEKEKYEQVKKGKYIDEMMNKHSELIKFIDNKNMGKYYREKYHKEKDYEKDIIGKIQRWEWRENQSRGSNNGDKSMISAERQQQKIEEEELDEEVFKFGRSKLIKMRNIQDMIAQTKLQRLKQRQSLAEKQRNNKILLYKLNNSQEEEHFQKVNQIDRGHNKDYRNLQRYDKIDKQIQSEFISHFRGSRKLRNSPVKLKKL